MGRYHHRLFRLQPQQADSLVVCLGVRLVVSQKFAGQNPVPTNAVVLGAVHRDRLAKHGQHYDSVPTPQLFNYRWSVGPGVETVPDVV